MSASDKSPIFNLEQESKPIDFGNTELNDAYKKLDEKSKKEIDAKPQEKQKKILELIINPDLKRTYDDLPEDEKAKIDSKNIVTKYEVLLLLFKQKQKQKQAIAQEKEAREKEEKE
jgi:hypothetical protein